jgi:hypothetical protein
VIPLTIPNAHRHRESGVTLGAFGDVYAPSLSDMLSVPRLVPSPAAFEAVVLGGVVERPLAPSRCETRA